MVKKIIYEIRLYFLGEPTLLKPYIVHSVKPGKEAIERKSWIYIMYEKDKIIRKKEELQP